MADGAKVAPTRGDDAESGTGDVRLRDLMDDPAAFEARLEVARAKRLEVLARKRSAGTAGQPDRGGTSGESPAPTEVVRPLRPKPSGRAPGGAPRSPTAPAGGSGGPGTPAIAHVETLPQPRARDAYPPLPTVAEPAAVPLPSPAVTSGTGLRRRSRRWPLAAGALVFGVALGVGAAAIVPQLDGWRIVIVRSPGADGDGGTDGASAGAASGEGGIRGGPAQATPPGESGGTPSDLASAEAQSGERGAGGDPDSVAEPAPAPDRTRSETPDGSGPGEAGDPALAVAGEAGPDAASAPETAPGPERVASREAETVESAGAASGKPGEAEATGAVPEAAAPESEAAETAPQDGQARAETDLAGLPDLPATSSLVELPPGEVTPEAEEAEPAPAAAAGQPETAERPLASAGARVVLHHPPNAAAPARAAAEALASAGLADLSVSEVDLSITAPNVRFFHDADRAAAGDIAAVLSRTLGGEDVASRSFVAYRPKPAEGLIEIWLSGEAPANQAPPAPTSRAPEPSRFSAEARREADRQRLVRSVEERLRQQLR